MCSSDSIKLERKRKELEIKVKRKLDIKIGKLEREYKKLDEKANHYSNNRIYWQIFVKYKQKAHEVKDKIYNLIVPYLEANDIEFKNIALENYEILETENFKMKTLEQSGAIFGNYAAEMRGKINKNGLLYLSTTKSDLAIFNPFSKYEFPRRLKGKIDCLGYVRVEAVEVGAALFKTIPKFYIGTIGKYGEIDLVIADRDSDYISGKIMMSKLVGNLLLRKEVDDKKFWNNSDLLIEKIENFRNNYR